jgi:hypothetical protein
MKIITAILNCINLRSFRYLRILYNEFPYKVYTTKDDYCSINYNSSDPDFWINVSGKYSTLQKSGALLHEIGHYIDYMNLSGGYSIRDYMRSDSKEIHREKTAWKNAIRLSDKYNIKIDFDHAVECLGTYGTSYKVLENRSNNDKD